MNTMKTFREYAEDINEAVDGEEYTVVLLGGSIGEKPIRTLSQLKGDKVIDTSKIYTDKDEAKKQAKQMNKYLSPGEKKYYRLKYTVATIVNGVYTGK